MSTIKTVNGLDVPHIDISAELIVNSTIVLYGGPKNGKTVAILDLLYIIKDEVPNIIVVSPTNDSNKSYSDIVPSPLIHKTISGNSDSKGKKESHKFLAKIIERQEYITSIYNITNDLKTLKAVGLLLSKKTKSECDICIKKLNKYVEECNNKLKEEYTEDEYDTQLEKLTELTKGQLIKIFRTFIKKDREYLMNLNLNEKQQTLVNYIDINPRIVLVFDDCAAELKPHFKNEEFRKLFYNNRHSHITLIISCQDETDLDANLRKSARLSIFAESGVFLTYIQRGGKFTKEHKAYATAITELVFTGNRKMIYSKNGRNPKDLYHHTFSIHKSFKFGSEAIRELCEVVANKEDTELDINNSFHKNFRLD